MTRPMALLVWMVCILVGLYAAVAQLSSILFGPGLRASRIAVAWDQLFNASAGGWPDETVSSRAYRTNDAPLAGFINTLFGDEQHCKNAYFAEIRRRQMPPEMRN